MLMDERYIREEVNSFRITNKERAHQLAYINITFIIIYIRMMHVRWMCVYNMCVALCVARQRILICTS